MANTRRTRAYFYVLNFDCDHTEITKKLGFSPTEARNRAGSSGTEYVSMWRYTVLAPEVGPDALSGVDSVSELLSRPTPIASCITSLLAKLESHADSIVDLGTQYQTGIHCSGEYGVELTADILNRLAAIGVRFDFACNSAFDDLENGPVA